MKVNISKDFFQTSYNSTGFKSIDKNTFFGISFHNCDLSGKGSSESSGPCINICHLYLLPTFDIRLGAGPITFQLFSLQEIIKYFASLAAVSSEHS